MASRQDIVEFILEQAGAAGDVSARRMFGDYGIYCRGKFIALVCDDRLFMKPTGPGLAILGPHEEDAPYPGARPHPIVPEERWDDAAFMERLFAETSGALPPPKPDTRKAKKP